MGLLGLGEPSLGTVIIFLGAWINRDFTTPISRPRRNSYETVADDVGHEMALNSTGTGASIERQTQWRHRDLSLFGLKKTIMTPNTVVFRDRMPSKVLVRFPFIMEIVYWTLIYGVSSP